MPLFSRSLRCRCRRSFRNVDGDECAWAGGYLKKPQGQGFGGQGQRQNDENGNDHDEG